MINSFAEIDNQLNKMKEARNKTIAIAAAEDEHVLEAACEAKKLGIADSVLVGNSEYIKEIAERHNFDISGFEIICRKDMGEAAIKTVELVHDNFADIAMKGLLDTSVFLKAVLGRNNGLRNGKMLSYAGLFEVHGLDRLIIVTDPGLNLEPTLEEKEIIMHNSIAFAHALGNECPKVAFICPIEKVNSRMNSTIHAKTLVEKYQDSSSFLVGGPFGLDNALFEDAARIKGVNGPVAGKADILIFNDIGAANIMYKSLMCFTENKSAGVVIGANVPVLMSSRSEGKESKLNCMKLGVLLSADYSTLTNIAM